MHVNDYNKARKLLSLFVQDQAKKQASNLGFDWSARVDAPGTYPELIEAFKASTALKTAMPVSSLFCTNIIYDKPEHNYEMRFWHDTLHVQTGLTFSLDDELELGLHHLKLAKESGINENTVAWQMLRVDTVGQNYLLGITGRFPINQRQFVEECLTYGLDEGLRREARRAPQ